MGKSLSGRKAVGGVMDEQFKSEPTCCATLARVNEQQTHETYKQTFFQLLQKFQGSLLALLRLLQLKIFEKLLLSGLLKPPVNMRKSIIFQLPDMWNYLRDSSSFLYIFRTMLLDHSRNWSHHILQFVAEISFGSAPLFCCGAWLFVPVNRDHFFTD